MTEPKEKPKAEIKTRQPQKKTPDTFANLHQPHPMEVMLGLSPTDAPKEPTPPTPRTARTPPTTGIAPERDFTRVANSIVREAVAGGYFIGKSKQIYDYLYQRTRGAIVPVRSATFTKPQLMRGAGIGSERTLIKNLRHLQSIGLVVINFTDGQHSGNEYTIYLPEELNLPTLPTPRTPPTPPHATQKVGDVPPAESGVGGVGSNETDSITYNESKTFSLRQDQIDDEAVPLRQLERELTGKNAATTAHWNELFELLATELKIAAARTTVSNVPAFLTEHLRRRLFKASKEQMQGEGREAAKTPTTPQIDVSKCPDCGGSGWWYPEGLEKGVAKCKHAAIDISTSASE